MFVGFLLILQEKMPTHFILETVEKEKLEKLCQQNE